MQTKAKHANILNDNTCKRKHTHAYTENKQHLHKKKKNKKKNTKKNAPTYENKTHRHAKKKTIHPHMQKNTIINKRTKI